MSTIHFKNSFNPQSLVKSPDYSLYKAIDKMLKNNETTRSNVSVTDISAVIPAEKYLNDYGAYRALGINLNGTLQIDPKARTWTFDPDVYPNGAMGYYGNNKKYPILDSFDPIYNPKRESIENRFFNGIHFGQVQTGIGTDYPILAETFKDKNGETKIKPGRISLQGVLPEEFQERLK